MNRRQFLGALLALPLVKYVKPLVPQQWYEIRLASYGTMVCSAPGWNGRILMTTVGNGQPIVVLVRKTEAADLDLKSTHAGAEERQCAICKATCIIAPVTIEAIKLFGEGPRFVCVQCFLDPPRPISAVLGLLQNGVTGKWHIFAERIDVADAETTRDVNPQPFETKEEADAALEQLVKDLGDVYPSSRATRFIEGKH